MVSVTHIHAPAVSVREQAALLVERLRRARTLSFRALVADAEDTVTVVARFLALLELYREAAVAFDQVQPLAELTVRWTGAEEGVLDVHDEFDGDAEPSPADDLPVPGEPESTPDPDPDVPTMDQSEGAPL
jgi:segregation and condensation protein A